MTLRYPRCCELVTADGYLVPIFAIRQLYMRIPQNVALEQKPLYVVFGGLRVLLLELCGCCGHVSRLRLVCSLLDYGLTIPQARYIVNTLSSLFSPAAKK